MQRRRSAGGAPAARKKSAHIQQRFRYQLVRALPNGELQDLTPEELAAFEAEFPQIAARWVAAVGGGGDPRSWQEQCVVILDSLMSVKIAIPFLQPVDPVALQLPDYFSIIKNPMDLGTAGRRG
eukprot:5208186-Pleurochrysis_carterae.AAC.2